MGRQKVAIISDWLVGGGAEKVVQQLHYMFPDAPIYTSYCTPEWREKLNHRVITGPLQGWPFSKLRKFIPLLRIWWFSTLNLKGYDLVISSSGAEAKGVKVPKNALHISYIHAPTHYYWSRYEQYLKNPGFGPFDWLARIGLKLLAGPLRRWDYKAAQRPDYLIANSIHTQSEIKKYYGRDSTVIHPPVDTKRFSAYHSPSATNRSGFVIAGRQTPYKRIDLAIGACTKLNLSLTVIGHGPDHSRLVDMAGPTIKFATRVTDDELVHYFQSAEAFIFPGTEDFGIVAVEAMAAGTPVIAYAAGGSLDFISPETGLFYEEETVESLVTTLEKFDPKDFSDDKIKKSASQFSEENFRKNIEKFISR